MMHKESIKARFIVMLGTILTLTLIGLLFGLAWPPLLTKAGPTLPPREPPTPSAPTDSDDDDEPVGAYIELLVQPTRAGLWAIVQWQDSAGSWHDVEGWQGSLDADGNKRWWVAAKDFGSGPFQWVVTQGLNGSPLATSDSFNLPHEANVTVRIEMSLRQ